MCCKTTIGERKSIHRLFFGASTIPCVYVHGSYLCTFFGRNRKLIVPFTECPRPSSPIRVLGLYGETNVPWKAILLYYKDPVGMVPYRQIALSTAQRGQRSSVQNLTLPKTQVAPRPIFEPFLVVFGRFWPFQASGPSNFDSEPNFDPWRPHIHRSGRSLAKVALRFRVLRSWLSLRSAPLRSACSLRLLSSTLLRSYARATNCATAKAPLDFGLVGRSLWTSPAKWLYSTKFDYNGCFKILVAFFPAEGTVEALF